MGRFSLEFDLALLGETLKIWKDFVPHSTFCLFQGSSFSVRSNSNNGRFSLEFDLWSFGNISYLIYRCVFRGVSTNIFSGVRSNFVTKLGRLSNNNLKITLLSEVQFYNLSRKIALVQFSIIGMKNVSLTIFLLIRLRCTNIFEGDCSINVFHDPQNE